MFYFLFLWFMKNGLDHNDIENESKQLNHWNDNFDDKERQDKYNQLEVEKQNASKDQLNKAEYLINFLQKWDLELDKDSLEYISYIKNGWKAKNISNELAFLKNSQYIAQTQKKYEWLFEKVTEEVNKIDIISELYNVINQWWNGKNNIHKFKRKNKKLFKNIKKLQKYERWEFIDFPNWLSFELCKWRIAWSDTTDYYIQTHIERNTKYYTEYVDSLLNMRELFKSKWINIKYWHRETWLANREFIEAYEKIRKIKKWKEYEKPNRLKVLEQTEQAVIFEKAKNSNPIRFIKEGTDLHNFATGEGENLFHETEMRLDLDRLEILNWLKEKNDYIIENYSIKDIINNENIEPKDKIHTIINIIHNEIKNWDDHRKVTIDWKILPFSCWNKALLLQQIFKEYWNELWITESYIAQPNWHVMNIVKFNWDYCIVDSSDGAWFANIQKNIKIKHVWNINVFKLKSPLKNKHWEYNYTIFPLINLWNKTELYESVTLEEYDLSVKEKMYQKASTNDYKELKAYVETLINSNELNPLNYFTWEEYLWIAKNKEDIKYKKQIKELEYLMQDTKSLNEIQERRKILQTIKQELDIDENLINKINNKQKFFNKISKSIAKFFK